MKHEPVAVCMFDTWYLSNRDSPELPSEHDLHSHTMPKNRANIKGKSYKWHTLLVSPLFGDKTVGMGFFPDGSVGIGRYTRRYSCKQKKAKKEKGISKKVSVH